MQTSLSSLFFDTYLYFGGYIHLWVMVAMWNLLRGILGLNGVDYQEQRVFGNCPSLMRLMYWMAGLLVGFTAIYVLGLLLILNHYLPEFAMKIAPAWPSLPIIVYPLMIVAVLYYEGLLSSLWRMIRDIMYLCRENGPSFRDAFVMDLLTSITKALSDMTCSWYRWVNGDEDVRRKLGIWIEDPTCSNHYVAVSVAMALPYAIRLFQCLQETLYVAPALRKWSYLNALKFFSSLLVLVFAGLEAGNQMDHELKTKIHAWYTLFAAVNSCFAASWDIWIDWQLPKRFNNQSFWPNLHPVLKRVLYSLLGAIDLALRCSWAYKQWMLKPPYSSLAIFTIAIAEILRRFLWAFFRVERQATGGYQQVTRSEGHRTDEGEREPLLHGNRYVERGGEHEILLDGDRDLERGGESQPTQNAERRPEGEREPLLQGGRYVERGGEHETILDGDRDLERGGESQPTQNAERRPEGELREPLLQGGRYVERGGEHETILDGDRDLERGGESQPTQNAERRTEGESSSKGPEDV